MILERFFNEVFSGGIYDPVRELGRIGVVLDVGACTGEFSLWENQRATAIYAIEGVKELYGHLWENVREFLNIKPFHLALGDRNGKGHMAGGPDGGASLSLDETPTNNEVEIRTLAAFMKENEIGMIDCLKIDIENGESAVFRAPDFPDIAKQVRFIIGEHVPPTSGELLKSLGYEEHQNEKAWYYTRND